MRRCVWMLAIASVWLLMTLPVGATELELEPCEIPGLQGAARCGTYEVFEDRQAMAGRKIPLYVVLLPARGENPEPDPVVFFAGGPGGSTAEGAVGLATFYQRDLDRRDFLLVDYRGTGKSNPLFCPYQQEQTMGVTEALETFIPVDRLAECIDALDDEADLSLYTTPDIVDDVAGVARALGYQKVNLSGGSYGSRAVLVFMRRHPEMVRTALIEGVVPTDARIPVTFATDAQSALDGWYRECAADADCHAAFPEPAADLATVLAALEAEPQTVEVVDPESRQVVELVMSRHVFVQALRYMLYSSLEALKVPAFVHAAANGDWVPIAQTAYSVGGMLMASLPDGLYLSVTCPEDVSQIGPNAAAIQTGFLGDFRLIQQVAACEAWVESSLPEGFYSPVESDAPVLILSGERDPVTPARWGYEAQEYLPNSVHLTVPDGGHGWYGLSGVECVDDLASQLFETGTVEGLDMETCLASIERPPFLLEIPKEDEIEMSREELARFAGTYTAEGGGFQVVFQLAEEGLIADLGGDTKRLVPIAPLRLKILGSPPGESLDFVEENGEIVAVELVSGSVTQVRLAKD